MKPSDSSEEEPVICLGGCKKELTSDISLARGYGPDCWRKLHRQSRLKPRHSTPAAEAGEGQTELDLYEYQPTLWSA